MDSKKDDFDEAPESEGSAAPRARNRTVMLTPEMTGQLRSRMGREGIISQDPQAGPVQSLPPGPPPARDEMPPQQFRPVQKTPQHPIRPDTYILQQELDQVRNALNPPQSGGFQAPATTPPAFAKPVEPGAAESKTGVYWSRLSPVLGFLVSYDDDENGEVFDLRQGRVIVTCERAGHGDYLVINDQTISPMHAILRITAAGEVQVLDQLSEYGTKIQRMGSEETEDLSGERSAVSHGDVLYFGKRSFHVCMVVRNRS